MSEQTGRETDEVFSSIGDTVRGAVFVAIEVAILVSARRAERAARVRAESDAAARRYNERMRAERAAAMPIMRQPWNDRWWRRATPEQIGNAWQITESWANNGDPYARTTLQYMREQIRDRYGVDVPETSPDGTDLAEIIGAGRDVAGSTPEQEVTAEEFSEPGTTYRYAISGRDEDNRSVTATEGVLRLPHDDGRPIELVAAETLLQYQKEHPHSDYSITMRPDPEIEGEHPYTLYSGDAEGVRDAALKHRARILSGEQEASPEELRGALWAERRHLSEQIRDNDPRFAHARDQLAAQLDATGAETTGRSPAARPVADAADRTADARERLAQLNLRLRAVEAEIRGENGSHVIEAAALRSSLDDGWWQTANTAEVTHIYGHVQSWSDGEAKEGMLSELQAGISRHYGVSVDKRATPEEVDNQVYQGQAATRDRTALDYRIDTTLTTGERRDVMSGRTSAPKDEPSHETARRVLNEHIGDLDTARNQRLNITLTERGRGAIRSFTAADLADADAQRLRSQSLDEDAGAMRAIEAGNRLSDDEPALAEAERQRADELRQTAEQDRAAAASLEGVTDREAAEAVAVAAEGWSQNPTQRFAHSTGRDRPRRGNVPRRPRAPERPSEIQR